jgi:hypothetical protein
MKLMMNYSRMALLGRLGYTLGQNDEMRNITLQKAFKPFMFRDACKAGR